MMVNKYTPKKKTWPSTIAVLDWWTDTKNHFYASNKIHLPVGLHICPP